MLARSEVGTLGHVQLWLSGENLDETFQWSDPAKCLAALYAEAFELGDYHKYPELCQLDSIARDCSYTCDYTHYAGRFSDVYDALCKRT